MMTSFLSRNISFSGIFEELLCGCQAGLHDSIRVLQQHKHFPYYEMCLAYQHHAVSFLSADPVVSSFAISLFNDAINIVGSVMLILS